MKGQILLAGVTLLLAGCGKERQLEPAVQTVRAGMVEEIHPDLPERYSASIEPFAEVALAFKSGGIVDQIHQERGADGRIRNVQAGDRVTMSTELARVRPVDYQNSVNQAEGQRATAEAELVQASAQLERARADFNEAGIAYLRDSNLFKSASLVKPQYDQTKAHYEESAASVAAAEATVRAAEGGVARAHAALDEAKLSLSDTAVHAPFAGWISARNIDRGSLVSAATVGFTILDTHLVKAVFAVPDSSLPTVRLGQKLPVSLEALQRELPGVITSISPQADSKSRVFSVEVTLENSREEVRPGMIGSLTLSSTHDGKPRLVVPLGAVVQAPGNPQGFAVYQLPERDGKSYACAQAIDIGQTFGNSIEVTRGLAAGARIIVLGGSQVRDGQQVKVIP